jgi:Icc-related predicted phosphoesterase
MAQAVPDVSRKLRIFAASDLHNDSSRARQLADQAAKEGVDLILLGGDVVEDDTPEGIVGHFAGKGKPVLMVPGNHDFTATPFLAERYGAKNLHAYSLKVGDVGFFGCGGANVGLNALSEDEIYQTLIKAFERVKDCKRKVMVTHVHPSGSLIEQFSRFVKGSPGVRAAIDRLKPDIAICGHVHEAEGIEEKVGGTTVVNVGKRGKVIEL